MYVVWANITWSSGKSLRFRGGYGTPGPLTCISNGSNATKLSTMNANCRIPSARVTILQALFRICSAEHFLVTPKIHIPEIPYIPQDLSTRPTSPIFRRPSLLKNPVYSAGLQFGRRPLYSAGLPSKKCRIFRRPSGFSRNPLYSADLPFSEIPYIPQAFPFPEERA